MGKFIAGNCYPECSGVSIISPELEAGRAESLLDQLTSMEGLRVAGEFSYEEEDGRPMTKQFAYTSRACEQGDSCPVKSEMLSKVLEFMAEAHKDRVTDGR